LLDRKYRRIIATASQWHRIERRLTARVLNMLKTNAVTRRSDKSAVGSQLGRRSNSEAYPTTHQERRESAEESLIAVNDHGPCTEIVRRFFCAYTACVRRFYGALYFLKRSYCDFTTLSRRPLRTQDDSTAFI
jgi:hypothetical protein